MYVCAWSTAKTNPSVIYATHPTASVRRLEQNDVRSRSGRAGAVRVRVRVRARLCTQGDSKKKLVRPTAPRPVDTAHCVYHYKHSVPVSVLAWRYTSKWVQRVGEWETFTSFGFGHEIPFTPAARVTFHKRQFSFLRTIILNVPSTWTGAYFEEEKKGVMINFFRNDWSLNMRNKTVYDSWLLRYDFFFFLAGRGNFSYATSPKSLVRNVRGNIYYSARTNENEYWVANAVWPTRTGNRDSRSTNNLQCTHPNTNLSGSRFSANRQRLLRSGRHTRGLKPVVFGWPNVDLLPKTANVLLLFILYNNCTSFDDELKMRIGWLFNQETWIISSTMFTLYE